MSAFYDNLASTATRLLSQFGGVATVTEKRSQAYDPANSVNVLSEVTRKRRAALFDFRAGTEMVRGTEVLSTDKRCILNAQSGDLVPEPGAKITVGAVTYTVVTAGEINPAGTGAVIFDLHVRAG